MAEMTMQGHWLCTRLDFRLDLVGLSTWSVYAIVCTGFGTVQKHSYKTFERGIHPGFKTQGRCHQKSKTEVSVALLMSSKIFKKKRCNRSLDLPDRLS